MCTENRKRRRSSGVKTSSETTHTHTSVGLKTHMNRADRTGEQTGVDHRKDR